MLEVWPRVEKSARDSSAYLKIPKSLLMKHLIEYQTTQLLQRKNSPRERSSASLLVGLLCLTCLSPEAFSATSQRSGSVHRNRRPASDAAPVAAEGTSPAERASEELLKQHSRALVRITVSLHGVPLSTGNGFFTGNDGGLLTAFSVIRSAILVSGTVVEFKMSDGSVSKSFSVASCGDQRNMDLCRIRLPLVSKNFFELKSVNSSPGDKIYLVNHAGSEFFITAGATNSARSSSANVGSLIISTRVRDEGLGAPVLNSSGEVVGMSARFFTGTVDDYGIIAADELQRYITQHSKFMPVADFVRDYHASVQRTANEQNKMITAPALKKAASGQSLQGLSTFRESVLNFGDESIRLSLPVQFEACALHGTAGLLYGAAGISSANCPAKDGSSLFSIERIRILKHGTLQAMHNKRLVEAKPFSAVENLEAVLKWKSFEKKLKTGERSQFFSQPSLANCRRLPASPLPGSLFSSAFACRFTVKADSTPTGYTSSIWLESGDYIYGMNMWMQDAALAPSLNNIASVAALSTRKVSKVKKTAPLNSPTLGRELKVEPKNDPNGNKPNPGAKSNVGGQKNSAATQALDSRGLASVSEMRPGGYYKMSLPSGVVFLSSKHRSDNTQYDNYGYENSVGAAGKNYVLVVDRMNVVFRPSDYDKSMSELVSSVTKALRARVADGQNSLDTTTLDGLPARQVSTTGTRDGKDVLILMTVGFGPSDTHLITQISDSDNPTKSFADFRLMTSSFKRK